MLVFVSATRKEILLRILADTSRVRSHEIKQVREDILLNQHFYEEYQKILASPNTRAVSMWNRNVEDATNVLRGLIGDFLSEKWKNSFLVKLKK
ncbi:MAG: hypothetical protein PHP82_01810 [Candidatus ainarchaeum sp.]|nr:hypothetical protein [Candidatus ainarchaeum sp.]